MSKPKGKSKQTTPETIETVGIFTNMTEPTLDKLLEGRYAVYGYVETIEDLRQVIDETYRKLAKKYNYPVDISPTIMRTVQGRPIFSEAIVSQLADLWFRPYVNRVRLKYLTKSRKVKFVWIVADNEVNETLFLIGEEGDNLNLMLGTPDDENGFEMEEKDRDINSITEVRKKYLTVNEARGMLSRNIGYKQQPLFLETLNEKETYYIYSRELDNYLTTMKRVFDIKWPAIKDTEPKQENINRNVSKIKEKLADFKLNFE